MYYSTIYTIVIQQYCNTIVTVQYPVRGNLLQLYQIRIAAYRLASESDWKDPPLSTCVGGRQ